MLVRGRDAGVKLEAGLEISIHPAQDAVVIGGLEMQAQLKALAARPHVVIATPGRLQVLHRAAPAMPAASGILKLRKVHSESVA